MIDGLLSSDLRFGGERILFHVFHRRNSTSKDFIDPEGVEGYFLEFESFLNMLCRFCFLPHSDMISKEGTSIGRMLTRGIESSNIRVHSPVDPDSGRHEERPHPSVHQVQ